MIAACLSAYLTSTARADSTADVDKLVRAHVEASVGRQGSLAATLAAKHAVVGVDGHLTPFAADCIGDREASACGRLVPLFGPDLSGTIAYSNIKPIVRADDKRRIASFFVTAELAGELASPGDNGPGGKTKGKTQMRIAGAARLDKDGWKVVGVKYTGTLPDDALAAYGATFATTGGTAPKTKLEKEVRGWFGHLADHQSANAIGISGTAPVEVATDPAGITKLAKAIDGLTLKPYSSGAVEAGDIAFVYIDLTLVSKVKSVDLAVGIVLVKEGGVWKWTAIDFGALQLAAHLLR